MTDNEIIKALECCSNAENILVKGKTYKAEPLSSLFKDALDLLNRKDAENEVLKKIQQKVLSEQDSYTTNDRTVCDDCERIWLDGLLKAKTEAYKKFALKIKMLLETKAVLYSLSDRDCEFAINQATALKAVDTIYKELTEGR